MNQWRHKVDEPYKKFKRERLKVQIISFYTNEVGKYLRVISFNRLPTINLKRKSNQEEIYRSKRDLHSSTEVESRCNHCSRHLRFKHGNLIILFLINLSTDPLIGFKLIFFTSWFCLARIFVPKFYTF